MPRTVNLPAHTDAWSWLCGLAASERISLQTMTLSEAADCAVARLENQRDCGLALNPRTVQVATLLVCLESELMASGASSAVLSVERAYVRERARLLAGQHAAAQSVWTRIRIPEKEPEPEVMLFDLVSVCKSVVLKAQRVLSHLTVPKQP